MREALPIKCWCGRSFRTWEGYHRHVSAKLHRASWRPVGKTAQARRVEGMLERVVRDG